MKVTRQWYLDAMRARIGKINWRQVRTDVARFVPAREQEGLRAWSPAFFSQLLDQLAAYLPER